MLFSRCQRFFSAPGRGKARGGKAIRRTAGDALAHTNSSQPAGNPQPRVYGLPGSTLPRHGSFGFNWGQGEGCGALGATLPSIHLPAQQRRAGWAQAPLCKTSRS